MLIVWELRQHLHCHDTLWNADFLGEEIGTDGGFVLCVELLVHVLVHQRGLTHG